MKTYILSLSLGILFFISGCGPKITPEQQEKLETLSRELDSTAKVIQKPDSIKIKKISDYYHSTRKYITKEMDDTLDRETLFYLDTFLVLKKVVRFFDNQYFPILRETEEMQKQINDLKHDINEGLIDEKRFEEYYQLEQDNFLKLKNVSSEVDRFYQLMLGKYQRMSPKIDSIINATKAKTNE